jgi:hypothetical protein
MVPGITRELRDAALVTASTAPVVIYGRISTVNTHRLNALVAILARIDKQIVESDTLLLQSLTIRERHRVTDELAYLQIE